MIERGPCGLFFYKYFYKKTDKEMSRLTSKEIRNLVEAYQEVYAPQITEEQIWEEVEVWVDSLIEEGYDLSDYTWEEMYEAYLEEQPMSAFQAGGGQAALNASATRRNVRGGGTRMVPQKTRREIEAQGSANLYKAGGGDAAVAASARRQNVRGGGTRMVPQLSRREVEQRGAIAAAGSKSNKTPTTPADKDKPTTTPTDKDKPTTTTPTTTSSGSGGASSRTTPSTAGKPSSATSTPARASSPANATTAQKVAGGMEVWKQQKAAGDTAAADKTGKMTSQLKYGDQLKPKTPNPLMKNMPGRNQAELDQIRGNAALSSISQSPSANKILSGTARSAQANQIGKASLDRSAASITAKPAPAAAKPAPAATPAAAKPAPATSTAAPAANPFKGTAATTAVKAATSSPPKRTTQLFHTDLFDLVKGYLLDEGYADTEESALAIMSSMSEEWKEEIIELYLPWDKPRGNKPSPRDRAARRQAQHTQSGDTERAKQISNVRTNMRQGINVTAKKTGTDPSREGTEPATRRHVSAAQRRGGIAGGKMYAAPAPGTPPSKEPSLKIPTSKGLQAKNKAAQSKLGGSSSLSGVGPSGSGKFTPGQGRKFGLGGVGLAD